MALKPQHHQEYNSHSSAGDEGRNEKDRKRSLKKEKDKGDSSNSDRDDDSESLLSSSSYSIRPEIVAANEKRSNTTAPSISTVRRNADVTKTRA